MGDKEELLQVIDERFTRLEDKFDKMVGRLIATVAIAVTLFIFIVGGSFAYTNKVEADTKKAERALKSLEQDVCDIDGVLKTRFPESAIFGEANKRIRKTRGQ